MLLNSTIYTFFFTDSMYTGKLNILMENMFSNCYSSMEGEDVFIYISIHIFDCDLKSFCLFCQVSPEACIHAPTPAKLMTKFHNKHVLVIGQEYRQEIAEEYPFYLA